MATNKAVPPEGEVLNIPFNLIEADLLINCREEMEGVDELAEDIAQKGLLQSLGVTKNGGDTYKLVSGFRRWSALKKLKFGAKMVPCVVRDYKEDLKLHAANLSENVHREDVHPFDLGKRFYELETGSYPFVVEAPSAEVPERTKVTREELSTMTGLSKSHITNHIRLHTKLDAKVKKLARQNGVPLYTVISWLTFTPEEQEAAFEAWKAERDERGGKAKGRGKGKNGGGGEESDDGGGAESGPSKSEIREQHEKLAAKSEKEPKDEFVRGRLVALDWILGNRSTLR